MVPVTRIAAAELPAKARKAALKLPPVRTPSERLVDRARRMASEAARLKRTFVAAGMSADFPHQLRVAADELSAVLSQRRQQVAERSASTARVCAQTAAARKRIKVLSAFVIIDATDDADLLKGWKAVMRSSCS
jgi:hypothetical protein